MVLWSNGDDTCFTRRKRWFDSIQDYCQRHGDAGWQLTKWYDDVRKCEVRAMYDETQHRRQISANGIVHSAGVCESR